MNHPLIAVSFLTIATILLWTAYRTTERRELTLGVGMLTLIVGGYAGWLAWFVPPPAS